MKYQMMTMYVCGHCYKTELLKQQYSKSACIERFLSFGALERTSFVLTCSHVPFLELQRYLRPGLQELLAHKAAELQFRQPAGDQHIC